MADQAERLRELIRGYEPRETPRGKRGPRIIAVASGKGGVGKTNLVVNLAIAFGQLGQKTIILDADIGLANVDILLDLKPRYTLVDVIRGQKELKEIMLRGPYNVDIIPGGSGLPEIISLDSQQREQLTSRLAYLEEDGNILLLDCSAGISRNVLSFIAVADDVILVTTAEPTAITDVYGMIKVIDNYRLQTRINLVVNMVRGLQEGENVYRRLNYVCRNFLNIDLIFLGAVEYDQHVQKAVVTCSPYLLQFPRSRAASCTQNIARRILNNDAEPARVNKGGRGFISRLFKLWN